MTRVAAIDIGTNTILVLVAERGADGRLCRIRDEVRFARLGEGLDERGSLSAAAVARGLGILGELVGIAKEAGAEKIAAVATQAMREADNAAEFLAPAAEILGGPVEVIAGEREAALVLAATRAAFPEVCARPFVIADVGGGSTEIIAGEGKQVRAQTSVPIGAVRLTERHGQGARFSRDGARALMADIDAHLAGVGLSPTETIIAVSGTATTLAAVAKGLRVYDPDRIHGVSLGRGAVERQLARYLELTVPEIRRLPGMEPARADVIAAGCAIYARLCARVSATELLVSERGVRWGLAAELFAR
ncbi:MAG TPA: hypothetical protein VFG83_05310 [Kofleriaceae bacterium]|nr:hypothetical protein [Kofleriaceae bacterium]